jgi:hypothetical protein
MTNEKYPTFDSYEDALVITAKEIQGDNYAGDDYYRQECWIDYWEDKIDPTEAVQEDMSYWD